MARAMRIGFFVVLGLLCFSVGVFLIGKQNFRFKRTYTLKTEFRNVQGLNSGAEVRVGGIHEGTIKEILLPADPNGKLTVIMDLDTDTNSLIKKDSVATIKTEGLLGDKYIEIAFGSVQSQFLRLQFESPRVCLQLVEIGVSAEFAADLFEQHQLSGDDFL